MDVGGVLLGVSLCPLTLSSNLFKLSKLISFFFCLGGGWAGTRFFMDPTSGIAVVSGVQEAPSIARDVELLKVYSELESILYHGLKVVV